MNALALLAELASAGVQVVREGDNLKVRARPGTNLSLFTERIRANKPALLVALDPAGAQTSPSTAPEILWMHVSRADVKASKPPDGWDGTLPATCAWPQLCAVLGPCPRHLDGGPCRLSQGEIDAH